MGYIYCITNLINNKKYIGKTVGLIQDRFKKHCLDSRKKRCEKRPLYNAINKYGIENFKIEEIEQVANNDLSEREIFWIKKYNTFGSNGYNATTGGDGKILYNHTEIVRLYKLGYTVIQIAQKIKCSRTTVAKILKSNNIIPRHSSSKRIDQFDEEGNYIQTFSSGTEAAKWLINNGFSGNIITMNGAIRKCCSHYRKIAYKYKWEYSKEVFIINETDCI